MADELLKILKAVHSRNAVHRDLKPENITLCLEGKRIVLIDYGISKFYKDQNAKHMLSLKVNYLHLI
jgi:serine/threonine protein kinase